MFKFIVDSDLHFKHDIRSVKRNNVQKITEKIKNDNIKAIICPGDLTNNGWDGKKFWKWKYGGDFNQLGPLKKDYVEPLEDHTNVYLCAGNHDTYVPWPYFHKGVFDYIKARHGSLRYSFDLKEDSDQGLHFICLHIYPDEDGIEFLQKDLKKNHDRKIVIYFHYNLSGPFSDWWNDEEKGVFLKTIKDYNIKAIIVGHFHKTYERDWNGYKIINGGGRNIPLVTYDPNEAELSVEFVK